MSTPDDGYCVAKTRRLVQKSWNRWCFSQEPRSCIEGCFVHIQGVPGAKVNILGGHSIGHSKHKTVYVRTRVLFRTVSEIELFHYKKTTKLRGFSPQANYTDQPVGEVSANFS
jgi:hypothetical protein